jgi:hypothetical protein
MGWIPSVRRPPSARRPDLTQGLLQCGDFGIGLPGRVARGDLPAGHLAHGLGNRKLAVRRSDEGPLALGDAPAAHAGHTGGEPVEEPPGEDRVERHAGVDPEVAVPPRSQIAVRIGRGAAPDGDLALGCHAEPGLVTGVHHVLDEPA